MKNRKGIIILIVFLVIFAVLLTALMCFLLNRKGGLSSFMYSGVSSELVFEETYPIPDDITIRTDASEIEINETDSDTVTVKIYSQEERTTVSNRDNKLEINVTKKSCRFFCINLKVDKIEVSLPRGYDKQIKLENHYGDIQIGDFVNAKVEVEEDCGDISIDEVFSVQAKNNYGDISVDKAKEINVDAEAGDIKIGTVESLKCTNHFGDIKVQKVTSDLEIENNCGDIEVKEVSLLKNSKITSDLGDVKIGRTNEIHIDADVDLGDKDIYNNYSNSEVTLTIENHLGDIKVKN